ncbi:DUF1801 domain-containing protein [Antarcticibacterium flavum]|uniref:DUF1801 domain-containing protein n=1 Tax=Antarcticibacterium flavum TaxID=2058175 RepID=A0A5B7X0M9_9FLAO|nr:MULTISPECIES: DUF1801 domain-containing protein [Antarcticibacterium]MCM4158905.1 DUF1801 domain-containing protein [Antarcticibacterium sp. W02-3]QCY68161.1 DUF1801 domain-containing protein [Antarcticibacterium flavum]
MSSQVTDYINEASEEQQRIMQRVRELIKETVPGSTEEFKWSRPVFRKEKDFAYLKRAKKYVTLGFFNFEKLKDEDNRLEGTGKDMRHVKLTTLNDLDIDLFKEWFQAAST